MAKSVELSKKKEQETCIQIAQPRPIRLHITVTCPHLLPPNEETTSPPSAASERPDSEVGMAVALVAASFGFKPGLDQTIFMAGDTS